MTLAITGASPSSRRKVDIQSLPNELLLAIFKAGSFTRPPRVRRLPFLSLVCSVNRHWRDVAINSPDLWCTILFSDDQPLSTTSLWLARSKSLLLDVTIESQYLPHKEFQDLVLAHLGRWRCLRIKSLQTRINTYFKFLEGFAIPRLEEFELQIHNSLWHRHSPFLIGETPSLRSVKLSQACHACLPSFRDLAFLDIRPFDSGVIPIYELIKASPGLTCLIIRGLYKGTTTLFRERGTIHAESLRSLAIRFNHTHKPRCSCLVNSLYMPNLEYLEFSENDMTPSHLLRSVRVVTSETQNQFSKLRTLRLQNLCFSCEDTAPFLCPPKIPFSHGLSILRPIPIADKNLVVEKNDLVPWRQLSVFTLTRPMCEDIAWVENIVVDRIKAGMPLTRVRLPSDIVLDNLTSKLAMGWLQGRVKVEIIEGEEGKDEYYGYDGELVDAEDDSSDDFSDSDDYDDLEVDSDDDLELSSEDENAVV